MNVDERALSIIHKPNENTIDSLHGAWSELRKEHWQLSHFKH